MRVFFPHQVSCSDDLRSPAEVQQELQEVRAEVLATKEELVSYKDTCGRLQEELQVCGVPFGLLL